MNWTFNQNSQLIIEDIPVQAAPYVYEYLIKDGNVWASAVNREIPLVVDVEDGLYSYFVFYGDSNFKLDEQSLEHPNAEFFSICNLRKCVFEHEKQSIYNFLNTCSKKNCNTKSNQDILLIAIFVLENLINNGKYSEATKIVNALSSCSNLCTVKTCNCNG